MRLKYSFDPIDKWQSRLREEGGPGSPLLSSVKKLVTPDANWERTFCEFVDGYQAP